MGWYYFPNGYAVSTFADRGGGTEMALFYYDQYEPKTIVERIKKFFRLQETFYCSGWFRAKMIPGGYKMPVKAKYDDKEDTWYTWRNLTTEQVEMIKTFLASLPKRESIVVPLEGYGGLSTGDTRMV